MYIKQTTLSGIIRSTEWASGICSDSADKVFHSLFVFLVVWWSVYIYSAVGDILDIVWSYCWHCASSAVSQDEKFILLLKPTHDPEIFMGCHHGHRQCPCIHLAVTNPVEATTMKMIINAGHLPTEIPECQFPGLMLHTGSFRMEFWGSRDLFTDFTAGEDRVRSFLPF